jgi:hypothetical protein
MTHIAIQEKLDGKEIEWMEKVRDERYRDYARRRGTDAEVAWTLKTPEAARLTRECEGRVETSVSAGVK